MKPQITFAATALSALLATIAFNPSALAQEHAGQKAIAVISATQGNKTAGKVVFTSTADGVHVVAELTGLEPGTHGFHIHEFGDISSTDGMSTGGHFNPHAAKHAGPKDADHHAGDMGNIEADKSGAGKLELDLKGTHLEGPDGIIGHAVVVHAKADDLKTQPSGNAGPRVGVGVIGAAKP